MACNDDTCTSTTGPVFPSNGNGQLNNCDDNCPSTGATDITCKPFQLSTNRDSCVIEGIVNEALTIGGATLNVYKLLGVHEQCRTVDATGRGTAISNGYLPGFLSSYAFDTFITEWRSIQVGDAVTASAYIGYDFGVIKTNDLTRRVYGEGGDISKHITAFAIKQSSNQQNRATKVRIERSMDGIHWYGVQVVPLPDDDCLNIIQFRDSAPMRYWRLRPTVFNGSATDYWGVQALELYHNYVATHPYNIQDKIFLENRDRDYNDEPLVIKGSYDLMDVATEITKFMIELPSQIMYLTVSFAQCVAILGRPVIIGDIIEVPSEAQYSAEMRKILKWMEVTDVSWSTEGYTPGWQPTLLKVIAQPAMHTQETQDIFGDLAENTLPDELGLIDKSTGYDPNHQDYSDVRQTIQSTAKDMVPQSGREFSSTIRKWEDAELQTADDQGLPQIRKIGLNPDNALYIEDAMPPNNAPFTEGADFPDSPSNGVYHRLVYEGLSKDVPARLYRYSTAKGRWVFLEKDRRAEYDPQKPRLQEYLNATGKRPFTDILRDNQNVEGCDE